ncbi:hypothetical protein HYALB_00005369 [Hymenoscyphus albidus]|uniref:Uncharacterized protein n=1 Tax=Hymenoscyphus albidus TaxID=595503 RepID=A0A9N9PYA6_9HELO|nr:hypothetical protein HYALB_00005369 [Hymenoscyphus albidus]
MADIQQRLQALSTEYQAVQQELQTHVNSRQKLESQQQENRAVQKVRDYHRSYSSNTEKKPGS